MNPNHCLKYQHGHALTHTANQNTSLTHKSLTRHTQTHTHLHTHKYKKTQTHMNTHGNTNTTLLPINARTGLEQGRRESRMNLHVCLNVSTELLLIMRRALSMLVSRNVFNCLCSERRRGRSTTAEEKVVE